MAIVGSGVATNRTNIQLPNEVAKEIIQKTQESSIIMRLARKTNLPGLGKQIPVIASDPVASWVDETGAKPVSNPTLDKKIMQAHKLAVIVPFSDEFRRDAASLYDALISRLPNVLGKKFDNTVFFGTGGSPLANFDTFAAVTVQSLQSNVYTGLVAADSDISEHGGLVNGYAFSPQARGVLLGALDKQDRPIFIDSIAEGSIPRILGAQTYFSEAAYKAGDQTHADIIGFAGDWTKAQYGTVEGVKITISDEATLDIGGGNVINLFQQNMFAVRAEVEIGFVAQTEYFNALSRTHSGGTGSTGETGQSGQT